MVGQALENRSEFGIVLAQEQGIVSVGCTVFVEEVLQRYDDGRLDILCRGSRRFEIVMIDEEKDYLRARVQFFDDEQTEAAAELRARALEAWEQAKPLLPEEPEVAPDVTQARFSFQLAETVPDLNARQLLLQSRDEEERLKRLISFFSTYATRQARVEHARRVAPTNGHGPMNGNSPALDS